jgi:hypothetical protein
MNRRRLKGSTTIAQDVWAKFMAMDDTEVERNGYAVTSGCEKGEDYYWICSSCFAALQDQLAWTVVAETLKLTCYSIATILK